MLKITLLTVAGFSFAVIVIMICQFLLKKGKPRLTDEGKFKNSYGIWFLSLIIAFSILTIKSIYLLNEAIDIINKTNTNSIYWETLKISSIFIGLNVIWLLVWYFIINYLAVLLTNSRDSAKELELDNTVFFFIRGGLLIMLMFLLLPAFELILRSFMPTISLPFFH